MYPILPFIIIPLQLEYMDSFFAQNGSKCLLFYYEEKSVNEAGERIS